DDGGTLTEPYRVPGNCGNRLTSFARALHAVMDDGGAVRGALIGHLDPCLSWAEQHVRLGDRTGFVRDRYPAGGLGGRIASDEDRFGHRELFAGVQAQRKALRLRLWGLGLR